MCNEEAKGCKLDVIMGICEQLKTSIQLLKTSLLQHWKALISWLISKQNRKAPILSFSGVSQDINENAASSKDLKDLKDETPQLLKHLKLP